LTVQIGTVAVAGVDWQAPVVELQ
jgi:hypothetical protein